MIIQILIVLSLAILGSRQTMRRWRPGRPLAFQQPRPGATSPQEPQPAQSNEYGFAPTPTDIRTARSILRGLSLPTELCLEILTFAEYWAILRAHRQERVSLSASSTPTQQAASLYLSSRIVPVANKKEDVIYKVQSITFKLKSHDQGWGGDPGCRNTYRGSYSWFEATILRPIPHAEQITSGPLEVEFPRQPLPKWRTPMDAEEPLAHHGWAFLKDEKGSLRTWHVQSNQTAKGEELEHEVRWTPGQPRKAEESDIGENQGKGCGTGFLDALQPGDRVALWARAQFPQWVNHVKEASIEFELDV